jgi:hypothetical protein
MARSVAEGSARLAQRHDRAWSAKSELARAIGYTLTHWQALTRYCDDGHIEIDNNAAERALRRPWKDCGGVSGYEDFVRAMADPDHPEHAHLAQWIGADT